MDIYEDAIQWVDTRLSGSDRPSRTDAPAFQRWLLRFRKASANLRVEIVEWEDWLDNYSHLWAA